MSELKQATQQAPAVIDAKMHEILHRALMRSGKVITPPASQPTAVPVAWLTEAVWGTDVALEKPDFGKSEYKIPPKVTALYAAPQPAREWQNLTEAELRYIRKRNQSHDAFARAIENKLQEKNS